MIAPQIDLEMADTTITNHKDLVLRITHLKASKLRQEEDLKHVFTTVIGAMNPVSILKDSIHELAENKAIQLDLTKVGLDIVTNFVIDKVLGRNRSIRGFLSSVLVEKLSGSFINNENVLKMIMGIKYWLSKKKVN